MFVSLFSDRIHAENWGCREPWRISNTQSGQWTLCTIDTSSLEEVYVFKVRRLIDALGVEIPKRAEQHQEGSYICLHKIPVHAMVEERDGGDIEGCYLPYSVSLRSLLIYEVASNDVNEYYDPYLGYSSDDSGVLNNINDDLMKMIEGDWN